MPTCKVHFWVLGSRKVGCGSTRTCPAARKADQYHHSCCSYTYSIGYTIYLSRGAGVYGERARWRRPCCCCCCCCWNLWLSKGWSIVEINELTSNPFYNLEFFWNLQLTTNSSAMAQPVAPTTITPRMNNKPIKKQRIMQMNLCATCCTLNLNMRLGSCQVILHQSLL